MALAEVLYAGTQAMREKVLRRCPNVGWRRYSLAGTSGLRIGHAAAAMSSENGAAAHANFIRGLRATSQQPGPAASAYDMWRERFSTLLRSFAFLPNTPTLANAGRPLGQLAACFVLPVGDNLDSILAALADQARIQKSGGGTGFSFSELRPRATVVASTAGEAAGPVAIMRLFDTLTDVISQGGIRRGANMGILRVDHPDIEAFIDAKSGGCAFPNFNLSVNIDNAFMQALRDRAPHLLSHPRGRSGANTKSINAQSLFERIVHQAWATGDPGIVFGDRLNGPRSNPTPQLGRIEATNPCGEQPLLPYEPCNLGSLNLAHFVRGPLGSGRLDSEALAQATAVAVRFLDNVISVNSYPNSKTEAMAQGNRRIGLGVMGWAEALVHMGIPYSSQRALDSAQKVMASIDEQAREASCALAQERGVFPNWRGSVFDPESTHFRGTALQPRNCARTTIAPTGTIALAAGLQGSGIEPFFGMAYVRRTAAALRDQASAEANCSFVEINPQLREITSQHNHFGLTEVEFYGRLAQDLEKHSGSLMQSEWIPERIRLLFVTAHDVSVDQHVRMQAAFQRHTDNAVSKTINLPNSASEQDVAAAYKLAWDCNLKGITVYRDGSRSQQVLSHSNCCPTA